MLAAHAASADPQVILPQGLPVQVKPTFTEPGLPEFTFPTAGGSLLGGSGSADTGNGGGDGSTSSGGGSTAGSGDAYDTMMAQSWGSAAANAAGAMGVSATALAATCAMESNCQNVGASGGGSASGAFQMINSTYTADINGAVAYDPAIAGTIVSGLSGQMDPTTEAYAASYELRADALSLQQNDGISDPTVLQTRAVYQFGGNVGLDVANAPDSANIAQLTGLSAASLAANGLNSSSTVGQWRQTIINKLGSATANQSVLQQ
ncbi:MAG TPA: hypothetical protein VFE60_23260 [Roseiarcus sp.]|nr:hypothetical protein [Roseiarcus sp.]